MRVLFLVAYSSRTVLTLLIPPHARGHRLTHLFIFYQFTHSKIALFLIFGLFGQSVLIKLISKLV